MARGENLQRENDQRWALEAIRIAPAEYRGTLVLFGLVVLAIIFVGALLGGAFGHHGGREE